MKDFPENPNYDPSKGLFNVLTNEQVEWIFDTMPERQKSFKATLDKMRKEFPETKSLLQDRINKAFQESDNCTKASKEEFEYMQQTMIEIEKFENQKEFKVKWN